MNANRLRLDLASRGLSLMRGNKVSRTACVHEAAHAVTRWYFGHNADRAEIFSLPRSSSPREAAATCRSPALLGLVTGPRILFDIVPEGMGFADEAVLRWYRGNAEVRAETFLVVIAAGVVAEAKRRRWSETAVWLGGGWDDYERAKAVAERWLPAGAEGAIDVATSRARALLGCDRVAKALSNVADALERRRSLDGDRIDALCRRAYAGRAPAHDAWSECWPPSLHLLGEGHVPVYDDDGEGQRARTRRSTERYDACVAA